MEAAFALEKQKMVRQLERLEDLDKMLPLNNAQIQEHNLLEAKKVSLSYQK
jgi:hypothetical protein